MKTHTFGTLGSPSLMLLPGLGVSYEMFLPLISMLKERFYIIAVEVDGFTLDEFTRFTSIDDQAGQAIAFVREHLDGELDCAYGLSKGLRRTAVFAAAMSTLASNINSSTTVMSVDFFSRLRPQSTDQQKVKFAKRIGPRAAFTGFFGSIVVLLWCSANTAVTSTFYGFIGLMSCFIIGYLSSFIYGFRK